MNADYADPLPELLGRAVDQLNATETDAESLARSIEAAIFMERRMRRIRNQRRFAGAGLAAAVVLGLLWYGTEPKPLLAQMADALKQKPWIYVEELEPPQGEPPVRLWISTNRRWAVTADHGGNVMTSELDPAKPPVGLHYDVAAKRIVRLRTDDDGQELAACLNLFTEIARGETKLTFPDRELEIDDQEQSIVLEGGRRIPQYRLWLKIRGSQEIAEVAIRIDPRTNLPSLLSQRSFAEPSRKAMMKIEYPADGPADIYALGISKETPVVDRVPPQPLLGAMESIRKQRRDFDSCTALMVERVVRGKEVLIRIYRDSKQGQKWCREGGVPLDEAKLPPLPDAGDDLLAWWDRVGSKFFRLERQAAGKDFDLHRERSLKNEDTHQLIQDVCYPWSAWPGKFDELRYDPKTPNHFDILETAMNVKYERLHHYEVDPKRGHVAMFWQDRLKNERGIEFDDQYRLSNFAQTPSGIWYAQRVEWKHENADPERNRTAERRYRLDFGAPIPDERFEMK